MNKDSVSYLAQHIKAKMSTTIIVPYKTMAKIIVGSQWFNLLELLAPKDQLESENSEYWHMEYLKAFSTKYVCDPITKDRIHIHMISNIAKW